MSGQLIFANNLDVIEIATVNYTLANFLQRTANQFYFAKSTTTPIPIPPEARDLLISCAITMNSDTVGLTITDILTAIIWSNVPTLQPTGNGQQQFSCDDILFPGLVYTGGAGSLDVIDSYVAGPNATAIAPLLTRREATAIYASSNPNTIPQNRIRNAWANGSGEPFPVPGVLPNYFQVYIQAATSADLIASTNPVFDVELKIYGLVQS